MRVRWVTRSHRRLLAALGVVVAIGLGSIAFADAGAGRSRLPVAGASLRGSPLRVIVAGNPPLSVDAGTGHFSAIRLPATASDEPPVQVVQVGRAAVILGAAQCERCGQNNLAFLVRHVGQVKRVGIASQATAAGRNGMWLLRVTAPQVCSIERVELSGVRHQARRSRCASQLEGGSAGLIFNSSMLVDPSTGKVRLRASGMLAATPTEVLRRPSPGRLVLEDIRDHHQRSLRWPSAFSDTETALVDPLSGKIALWFVNGPVDQHVDVWLLDPRTRRFTHVPGFPTAAELKRTSLTFTPDGRLVILTRIDDRDALVVWRPGARSSASEFLDLPGSRSPGVFAIAAW